MKWGTHHFETIRAAVLYYREQMPELSSLGILREVKIKLAEGLIAIGKPQAKPDERVYVGPDDRYWIEDEA